LHATTRDLLPVRHLPSLTSDTVGECRRRLAGAQPGVPRTIVLDHARDQRGALGQRLAQRLGMAWLCLPPDSPTLTLLARFWTFVQKPGLDSKYSADHLASQPAMIECMAQAPDKHQEALTSLLTLQLQSFKAVQVIGEASNISVFPVARRTQKKVSSLAA